MYRLQQWLVCIIAGLGAVQAATSVTQFGITWQFDADYQVGQFANGDWYVVGPVEITATDPAPTAGRNGSDINPLGGRQGYDSRGGRWQEAEQVAFPVTMQPGQSMVTAASNPDEKDCTVSWGSGWTNYAGGCSRGIMQTQAVLTCLDAAPAEVCFRPAYAGSTFKTLYPLSAVHWDLLPQLPSPASIPDLSGQLRNFERPWIDHQNGWTLQYTHAMDNHPGYGRDMATRVSTAAMYLMTDAPGTDSLAIRMIQLGIDNYGVTEAGGYWPNDGGHAEGRKWPILFAGYMLQDTVLQSIGQRSGAYMYTDGYGTWERPADYVPFGEDGQTFYVLRHPAPESAWVEESSWYGTDEKYDIFVPHPDPASDTSAYDSLGYRKHVYKSTFTYYGHGDGTKSKDFLEYTDKHEGMPEWGIRHSTEHTRDGLDWGAPYRNGTNGDPYEGYILAAHIQNLKAMWNHDALFDYVDRFVDLDGLADGFKKDMWTNHRADYGCVWTRNDTTDTYSNGAPDCSRCVYNCPGDTTAVGFEGTAIPVRAVTAWPNPVSGNTAVNFIISRGSDTSRRDVSTHYKIEIRTAAGDPVFIKRINDGLLQWDGCDNAGRTVDPGIYFYTVTTDDGVFLGRIMRTE